MMDRSVQSLPLGPSPKATIFSFHKRSRLSLICGFVVLLGCVVFVGYTGVSTASRGDTLDILATIGGLAVLGFMIVVTISQLRIVQDRVGVDDLGVWYLPGNGAPTLLEWRNLGGVTVRSIPTQCIDILDKTGSVRIRAQKRLQNFDALEQAINAHMPSTATRK